MSEEKPTETPEEAVAVASLSPAAEAPEQPKPSKADEVKAKIRGALARLKSKIPKVPKLNPAAIKTALKDGALTLLWLPVDIVRGDSLTRIAGIGFVAALGLFVMTGPRVLMLLKKKTPVAHLAVDPAPVDSEHEQGEEIKKLKAVAYLGVFHHAESEVEFFVECASDEISEKVQENQPRIHDSVTASLKEISIDELMNPAEKKEYLVELRDVLNRLLGEGAIKQVFLTKLTPAQ